ncbi:uncharacterized protein LOC108745117 [Agrilus planipennis]|uniref:Uncharacterized protein LOC108745117 n=1 Tax=Agrilus planipennis TaxID=224129 RepID=A0A1W4XL26_AGRPL|nr:uncharacterized protein LOC108745117 [Agrilus planipennis]
MFVFSKTQHVFLISKPLLKKCFNRTFLSQAYYCNEIWEQRLSDPIIKKVDLDVFYNELDLKYQKIRNISPVDVDIFANAVNNRTHFDELLDLVHKLRLSAETKNTLESTHHAVVRNLLKEKQNDLLLQVLDDRLNYGIFLDYYTTNLLLDTFWKEKDYLSGARTASQLMLQEDFSHPLNTALSLLHCYNYLLEPKEWPKPPLPEEPVEEKKVRVKYLRNPYYDDHFDLRDPLKIVGKTLVLATKPLGDTLEKSLHAVGLALWDHKDKLQQFIAKLKKNNETIFDTTLDLVPDDNQCKSELSPVSTQTGDLQNLLQVKVKKAEQTTSEKDIASQCDTYAQWIDDRRRLLDEQNQRYLNAKRLLNIEETQKSLQEREKLLWFFENQDKIELQIEANEALAATNTNFLTKKEKKMDENYIPPEVKQRKTAS